MMQDQKSNLVIFGISECGPDMIRVEYSLRDRDEVISVLAGTDENIEKKSLIDCVRLGKFNPLSERPHPILVMLA